MKKSKSALLFISFALLSFSCSEDNTRPITRENFEILSHAVQASLEPQSNTLNDPVQYVAFQYALNLFSGNPKIFIQQFKPDLQFSASKLEKVRPADLVKDFALYLSGLKKKCDNAGGIKTITTSKPNYSQDGYLADVKISVSFKDSLQQPHEEIVKVKKYGAEWLPMLAD